MGHGGRLFEAAFPLAAALGRPSGLERLGASQPAFELGGLCWYRAVPASGTGPGAALGKPYDWVVIDSSPRANALARSAIAASNLALIPVQPSPLDILNEVAALRSRLRARFVVNRLFVGTQLGADEVGDALGDFRIPALCTAIRNPSSHGGDRKCRQLSGAHARFLALDDDGTGRSRLKRSLGQTAGPKGFSPACRTITRVNPRIAGAR